MKHFKPDEFKCKCGQCNCDGSIHPKLAEWLDRLREYVKRPVIITSGIRCREHNAVVGGSKTSQHLTGCAADLLVRGRTPEQVALAAMRVAPHDQSTGVGIYKGWVHLDTGGRGDDAMWVKS